jgi:uncharacterized membrane protein
MAKIAETQFESAQLDDVRAIEIVPPKRESGWVWALVFAVLLIGGVGMGLTLATGSLGNAIEVTQTALATDGTSETATN